MAAKSAHGIDTMPVSGSLTSNGPVGRAGCLGVAYLLLQLQLSLDELQRIGDRDLDRACQPAARHRVLCPPHAAEACRRREIFVIKKLC